ncbi:hypothetical protein ACFX13_023749 [Malus domestica]
MCTTNLPIMTNLPDSRYHCFQFANNDSNLDVYDHIVEESIEDDHAPTVEDQGNNIPEGDNIPGYDTTEDEL